MGSCLLDTDIFSDILRGKHPRVVQNSQAYLRDAGRYTVSAITVMEVVKGLHRLGQQGRMKQFMREIAALDILHLDTDSAVIAGRIYADLERTGQPIGRADPMIAGIAIHHGVTLVTANTAHYRSVVGLGYSLQLDNWREP